MHGAVVRGTFCFWRMNLLAGIGVSIARNCSETQIFGENCRTHRAKRSFWKHCSMKFGGSLARNDHFGSFFCENCRKHRAKRSFWKLVLWILEDASRETILLEASSVKFGGSLARNDPFGSFFCENCRKHRAKRSFWKLVLWNLGEASHEMLVLEACSLKSCGTLARNARFGSFCSTGVVRSSTFASSFVRKCYSPPTIMEAQSKRKVRCLEHWIFIQDWNLSQK